MIWRALRRYWRRAEAEFEAKRGLGRSIRILASRVKISSVTFPRLDVDFHLAPFVDARDHGGVAAARVTIGAPHFEKPREFWARPLPAKMALNSYHPLVCSAPTHHEMLEARLQLHAWARENLPPSQAAELIALDDLN